MTYSKFQNTPQTPHPILDPEEYLSKTNLYLPRLPLCWVGMTDFAMARQQFKVLFQQFGPLKRFLYRPASKEVALVEFIRPSDAIKAFNTLNGSKCTCGNEHRLTVERQVPKKFMICSKWVDGECSNLKCHNAHTLDLHVYSGLYHLGCYRQTQQMTRSIKDYVRSEAHSVKSRIHYALFFARLFLQLDQQKHTCHIEDLLESAWKISANMGSVRDEISFAYARMAQSSLQSKKYDQVRKYVTRAFRSEMISTNENLVKKLNYCIGVVYFHKGQFRPAKARFQNAMPVTLKDKPVTYYLDQINDSIKQQKEFDLSPLWKAGYDHFIRPKFCVECNSELNSYGRLCKSCFQSKSKPVISVKLPTTPVPESVASTPSVFGSSLKDDDATSVGSISPMASPSVEKPTLVSILMKYDLTNLAEPLSKTGVKSLDDLQWLENHDIAELASNKVEQNKLLRIKKLYF